MSIRTTRRRCPKTTLPIAMLSTADLEALPDRRPRTSREWWRGKERTGSGEVTTVCRWTGGWSPVGDEVETFVAQTEPPVNPDVLRSLGRYRDAVDLSARASAKGAELPDGLMTPAEGLAAFEGTLKEWAWLVYEAGFRAGRTCAEDSPEEVEP